MFQESDDRNQLSDWVVRAGVAIFFLLFGVEKFSSDPASHWTKLFHQIGAGEWFQYLTGIVEVLASVFVLIPRTALIGLALLGCTMATAVIIVAFVLHQPGDSIFPGIFLVILAVIFVKRLGAPAKTAH